MKKILVCLFFVLSGSIAFAQNGAGNDPQISDRNYKHPNKAARAQELGLDQHYTAGTTSAEDNTNYKSSFKNKRNVTKKASFGTESPARTYSGRKTTRNYKNQF